MAALISPTSKLARLPAGVTGLDRILHGGFFQGGLYIITGPPGAGKTILGNQLCFHTVTSGGRAIFMTALTESHSRMLAHLSTLLFFDPEPIGRTLHYLSGYSVLLALKMRTIQRDRTTDAREGFGRRRFGSPGGMCDSGDCWV